MLMCVSALLLVPDMEGLEESSLRVTSACDPWRCTLSGSGMTDCTAAKHIC